MPDLNVKTIGIVRVFVMKEKNKIKFDRAHGIRQRPVGPIGIRLLMVLIQMYRRGFQSNVVIWKDGTVDNIRTCSYCLSSTCQNVMHKEKYGVIQKREQTENLRDIGIRINAAGAYVLDEEFEIWYPSENYSTAVKYESTKCGKGNQESENENH